jgi:hypothetical protein
MSRAHRGVYARTKSLEDLARFYIAGMNKSNVMYTMSYSLSWSDERLSAKTRSVSFGIAQQLQPGQPLDYHGQAKIGASL